MSEIYRYTVPTDDQWHRIELSGEVVHVDSYAVNRVEFWAMHSDDHPTLAWNFRVYGTGHRLPDQADYVGTTLHPPFVWHLMRRATS